MSYTVWTYNDDPKWLERNAGVRDMVLAQIPAWDGNPSDQRARFLCERLLELMPDRTFEIRDDYNKVLTSFSLREPLQSSADAPQRKRRALGSR